MYAVPVRRESPPGHQVADITRKDSQCHIPGADADADAETKVMKLKS